MILTIRIYSLPGPVGVGGDVLLVPLVKVLLGVGVVGIVVRVSRRLVRVLLQHHLVIG